LQPNPSAAITFQAVSCNSRNRGGVLTPWVMDLPWPMRSSPGVGTGEWEPGSPMVRELVDEVACRCHPHFGMAAPAPSYDFPPQPPVSPTLGVAEPSPWVLPPPLPTCEPHRNVCARVAIHRGASQHRPASTRRHDGLMCLHLDGALSCPQGTTAEGCATTTPLRLHRHDVPAMI
jgi:hypothetical protein